MSAIRIAIEGDGGEPPEWATLQRRLVDETAAAVEPVLERYVEADGSVQWPPADDYAGIDALDDAYESFHNWPLFYLLGGDDALFEYGLAEWEAITEQFAEIPTGLGHSQVRREYQQGHDWFHQSEGNLLFYHLCMADPTNERLIDRATRFAGFYLNEDPDVPPIYDEERNLIRCPMNGSRGPAFGNFSEEVPPPMYRAHSETRIPWQYAEWKVRYGLPFYDLDGVERIDDLRDDAKARRAGEAIRDRCSHSETPQNLAATTLLLNAFLLTGAEKYREWAIEYVDGWIERAERNGGLLPDNVGPSGEIGELIGGRWYGGWYGWVWPHGVRSLAPAFTAGAENAFLLTGGDESYLAFARRQFELLETEGYEEDGAVYVPYRYAERGDYPAEKGQRVADGESAGWFDFRPLPEESLSHLWYLSLAPADRERLERADEKTLAEWRDGLSTWGKDFGGNEHPWVAYLRGAYPEYPVDVLEHNLDHVAERLALVETDERDPATYDDSYFHRRNPVTVEGLQQLTTGAPQEIYNGGLVVGTVRHFDPERRRPGLPPDVAALVTDLRPDGVSLELVNCGDAARTAIVQAGALAEHRFTRVAVDSGEAVPAETDSPAATIEATLPPGAHGTLDLGLDRFAADPTYAFPWH